MSSPTEAEVITMLRNAVDLFEDTRLFSETNTPNYVADEDTLIQSIETDFAAEILGALRSARSGVNGTLLSAASVFTPIFRTWAQVAGFPESDVNTVLRRLHDRFVDDTSDRIASRQFTFGSPAAVSGNAGNGVIYRLTKDRDNFDIENQHAEAKRARCIRDEQSGSNKHEEEFELRGTDASIDALNVSGSGATKLIRALSARDSLLGNPSFSQYTGTLAAPTAITNWTVTSAIANFRLDTTNYYRDFLGDTTPTSIVFEANDTLSQALSVRRTSLAPNVPYLLIVRYRRDVTSGAYANGTLRIDLGSAFTTVALSAQTGWQPLLVPSVTGQNCWLENFNEANLDIRIGVSGMSTGNELHVDDVMLVPGVNFDGAWYWIVGGSTKFRLSDEFTWTDTEVGSKIQKWLWRAFGRYLPHATGSAITITDP